MRRSHIGLRIKLLGCGRRHALRLRDEYARSIQPARTQVAEALQLERQLSDLVNKAYALSPEEVALLWKTAPPRMPLANPND